MMHPFVKLLILRADASTQIGTGHVMRCLALAQAWQDAGGSAVFVMAMEAQAIESRLRSEGLEVCRLSVQPGSTDDAIQTADLARKMGATWVLVDGYHFGADYQRIIKDSGLHLLFVDDNGHAEHYYADIMLNQNIHAHEGLYVNREPYTRLLLGTRYVLLRREFLRWREWEREIPDVARKVLVTLGGADPDNTTLKVIQALEQVGVSGLEVVVVTGVINPHYRKLQLSIRDSGFSIRLVVGATNMPDLMAWAELAVSSASSTSWELAFMALPNLVLIQADNQRSVAERLDTTGIARNLGWSNRLSVDRISEVLSSLMRDKEIRKHMSLSGQEIVDGNGRGRVLSAMSRAIEKVV